MNRTSFDHLLRAAANVSQRSELTVVGSQAILASIQGATLFIEVAQSREVDFLFDDPHIADEIDGVLGQDSQFDITHGVHADGVDEATILVPPDWRDRLVRYESIGAPGVTAWCLSPSDLCCSKLLAGRPKDVEFVAAVVHHGLATTEEIKQRITDTHRADPAMADKAQGLLRRMEPHETIDDAPKEAPTAKPKQNRT